MIGLVLVAVACGGGGDKKSSVTAAQICAATPEPAVTLDAPDIIEASGIAASRLEDDVLWVHNDSGDTARVFKIDRQGRGEGAYTLDGATAVDWEDIAIGPGPKKNTSYLYIGDIGDNDSARPDITIYRAPEPGPPTPNEVNAIIGPRPLHFDSFELRYPDHAHDAETLMVDRESGDLFIVTKELATGVSLVFRARAMTSSGEATLEQVGQIDFKSLPMATTPGPDAPTLVRALPFLPTGGDISPDGSLIAIRTYGSVWVWSRAKGESVADALAGQPCEAPSAVEQQGEAIAFDADGRGYVTTSEGASPPLHHFVVQ